MVPGPPGGVLTIRRDFPQLLSLWEGHLSTPGALGGHLNHSRCCLGVTQLPQASRKDSHPLPTNQESLPTTTGQLGEPLNPSRHYWRAS